MYEKIKREELNNLISVMQKNGILQEWILGLCKVSSLVDLTVIQYNYLLIIIKRTEIKEVKTECY